MFERAFRLGLVLSACGALHGQEPVGVLSLPPSAQRAGDAARGARYFVEGDYVRSGPPLELVLRSYRSTQEDPLGRSGVNGRLPYYLSATRAPNGVPIATPNCLTCHAQYLEGELVVGLGNAVWDYTMNGALLAKVADLQVVQEYGRNSPEREAWAAFRDGLLAVGPHIRTAVVGVNPADKLAFVLAAHRDPETLAWSDEPRFALPEPTHVVPTDVPPLWGVRKKHALFYTGSGRGDFARIMMAASLLTLRHEDELREMEPAFVDVLAYLEQLDAPAWPWTIDEALRARGEPVFTAHCASCHGTYGAEESYPNLLVDLDVVGTDPSLAEEQLTIYATAIATLNASWAGEAPAPALLVPSRGYVAPPLDGVWATAPYLHNGSVPTLADLLDSPRRPDYWQRRRRGGFDQAQVGIVYKERRGALDKRVYDTTLPGYGNRGHTFGDGLSEEERRALVEYLKSL